MTYFRNGYRTWWQPILEILLTAIFWSIALLLTTGSIALVAWKAGHSSFVDRGLSESENMYDLAVFSMTLISVVVVLPASLLASCIVRRSRWRSLFAAGRRFNWSYFWLSIACALVVTTMFFGAINVIGSSRHLALRFDLLALVVLLVPLQSAAEELLFRGILGQAVGWWTRSWLCAVLLPIPLFVVGHSYSIAGLIAVGWFAFCAGYLAHRTQGLEAPIALHIANNLQAFTFGAVGLTDLNQTSTSFWLLAADAICVTFTTWLLLRLWESRESAPLLNTGGLVLSGNVV